MIGDIAAPTDICSRAGCTADATQRVLWRNPRIHTPDRVKVWLACDEHAPYLRDHLAARDFPVRLTPHPPLDSDPPVVLP